MLLASISNDDDQKLIRDFISLVRIALQIRRKVGAQFKK